MGKLGSGISPEKTDAAGLLISELGQFCRADPLLLVNPLPEAPILTEEAIEGTGLVEDRQVLVAVLRALCVGEARKA